MKERPILFSAPMVRAILDGRKTQTRRAVKPRHDWHVDEVPGPDGVHRAWPVFEAYVYAEPETVEVPCPFGEPGDRLWVRETWATPRKDKSSVWYRAGHVGVEPKWRPSIHMPRWASRITLEVTGVRVERLQAITEFDAIAEGVENTAEFRWRDYMPEREAPAQTHSSARESFLSLWESINGTESLAANPWVWVVSFERVTP